MEKEITIVIHPTCASSYRLVKNLVEVDLIDKIRLVDISSPKNFTKSRPWSVPWVVVDGKPIAADPIDIYEVAEIINDSWSRQIDIEEQFMKTVLSSAYASSLVYLWENIEIVLEDSFIVAAVRASLSGLEVEKIRRILEAKSRKLYTEWEEKITRSLAYVLIREYWWSSGGKTTAQELRRTLNREVIGLWLLGKASIGRVGLPPRPLLGREKTKLLLDTILGSLEKILARIEREQTTILGDREYWEILDRYAE